MTSPSVPSPVPAGAERGREAIEAALGQLRSNLASCLRQAVETPNMATWYNGMAQAYEAAVFEVARAAAVVSSPPATQEGGSACGDRVCDNLGRTDECGLATPSPASPAETREGLALAEHYRDKMAAGPQLTEADEDAVHHLLYGDWNGIEEAGWNLPHRALVDGLPISDEQRAAVHEALNDNYQHGHEDAANAVTILLGPRP